MMIAVEVLGGHEKATGLVPADTLQTTARPAGVRPSSVEFG